jgi:hypothetical protein
MHDAGFGGGRHKAAWEMSDVVTMLEAWEVVKAR